MGAPVKDEPAKKAKKSTKKASKTLADAKAMPKLAKAILSTNLVAKTATEKTRAQKMEAAMTREASVLTDVRPEALEATEAEALALAMDRLEFARNRVGLRKAF